jgi:two-component system response regulator AtoC
MKYNFPGNIRELKAIMELAAVMCDGKEITEGDIKFSTTKGKSFAMTEEKTMEQYYIDIVESFLKKYNNNVVKVATRLAVGKSTIYKMINNGQIKVD